jgi:hypothetical protein
MPVCTVSLRHWMLCGRPTLTASNLGMKAPRSIKSGYGWRGSRGNGTNAPANADEQRLEKIAVA